MSFDSEDFEENTPEFQPHSLESFLSWERKLQRMLRIYFETSVILHDYLKSPVRYTFPISKLSIIYRGGIPVDTRRCFNVYKTSIQRHRHRVELLAEIVISEKSLTIFTQKKVPSLMFDRVLNTPLIYVKNNLLQGNCLIVQIKNHWLTNWKIIMGTLQSTTRSFLNHNEHSFFRPFEWKFIDHLHRNISLVQIKIQKLINHSHKDSWLF